MEIAILNTKATLSSERIRQMVADTREAHAATSKGWRQTHGVVVDDEDRILTFIGAGAVSNGVFGSSRSRPHDPLTEAANARFMVRAHKYIPNYMNIIELLLNELEKCEPSK
jgi:hypothetical protein